MIPKIIERVDVAVEKISFPENLMDPFTKTLCSRVFDGQRDDTSVTCIPNMLWS